MSRRSCHRLGLLAPGLASIGVDVAVVGLPWHDLEVAMSSLPPSCASAACRVSFFFNQFEDLDAHLGVAETYCQLGEIFMN